MRLLKDISHLEFIIQDDYELDEIILKYGSTGDQIEEHLNGNVKNRIEIKRFFKCVEYYQIGENDYDITECNITKEAYFKAVEENYGDFIYLTGLNYEDFLDDFDSHRFDSFFEEIVLRDLFIETIESIENVVFNAIKDSNAKMILNSLIQYLSDSIWFLKKFKNDDFSARHDKSNKIQKELCGYFIHYNTLLLKVLKYNYKYIFPDFVSIIDDIIFENINIKNFREIPLLEDIVKSCEETQINETFFQCDENSRNRQILSLLKFSNKYIVANQEQVGLSGNLKDINSGEADGIIKDLNQRTISYVEFFNLSSTKISYKNHSTAKNVITEHINKLENRYDINLGLPIKFVVIYYNVGDNSFGVESNKYKEFIEKGECFKFKLNEIHEINIPSTSGVANTGIRIFKTLHNRDEKNVSLYHILVRFPKKKKKLK
ncbi:hypothetical protein [Flavobacterium polysaccharolyticum]|uniref:Uncharacterized protein n=1 Tax=Flavobacterium polysaccharolyticum TaxID=3133148 RepID=A0ABU9NIB2_9FLAO